MRRRWAQLLVSVCAALGLIGWQATPAAAAPALSCASLGITAKTNLFATVGLPVIGWLENLGFDGRGGMWVSELELNKLVRFDAAGQPGVSLPVDAPGASLLAPDGRMYAVYGDNDLNVMGTQSAGVATYDPSAADPVASPFASGLTMANGAALDGAGNLYVADTLSPGIDEYSPTGTPQPAFTAATRINGADGLAIADGTLYVTQLTSLGAAIVQVPLNDPGQYTVLTSLSPLLGPDDLTVGPDGALYVALASGQLVRVDPSTGAACVVLETGVPITSVRFAVNFPPYSSSSDAFLTSEAGEIIHVHLSGLKPLGSAPPPAAVPAMRLTLDPGHVRVGHATRVHASMSSASSSCRAGVSVSLGPVTELTGPGGRASFRLRETRTGPITATARKAGCQSTSVQLRVVAGGVPG
jgi:virginiamycin B lyase